MVGQVDALQRSLVNILRGHEVHRRSLEEKSAELQESLLDHTRMFEDSVERGLRFSNGPSGVAGPAAATSATSSGTLARRSSFEDIASSLGLFHADISTDLMAPGWSAAPERSGSFREIAERATAGLEGVSVTAGTCGRFRRPRQATLSWLCKRFNTSVVVVYFVIGGACGPGCSAGID